MFTFIGFLVLSQIFAWRNWLEIFYDSFGGDCGVLKGSLLDYCDRFPTCKVDSSTGNCINDTCYTNLKLDTDDDGASYFVNDNPCPSGCSWTIVRFRRETGSDSFYWECIDDTRTDDHCFELFDGDGYCATAISGVPCGKKIIDIPEKGISKAVLCWNGTGDPFISPPKHWIDYYYGVFGEKCSVLAGDFLEYCDHFPPCKVDSSTGNCINDPCYLNRKNTNAISDSECADLNSGNTNCKSGSSLGYWDCYENTRTFDTCFDIVDVHSELSCSTSSCHTKTITIPGVGESFGCLNGTDESEAIGVRIPSILAMLALLATLFLN